MIYIITVHFNSDKWIDIQLKYIGKHIHKPYRVFACLNKIDKQYFKKFYYAENIKECSKDPRESHSKKLDYLAQKVILESKDSDILVFIDGDAFPINDDFIPYIKKKIQKHKLVAVKRYENLGDLQPHPSFCATTVGFWKCINGDWGIESSWKNLKGKKVNDVGGNLLKTLNDKKINWASMIRSNKKNIHPLYFAIYDDMIYHHGAGFRNVLTRVDVETGTYKILIKMIQYKMNSQFLINKIIRSIGKQLLERWKKNKFEIKEQIYNSICSKDTFFKKFID